MLTSPEATNVFSDGYNIYMHTKNYEFSHICQHLLSVSPLEKFLTEFKVVDHCDFEFYVLNN